MQVQDGTALMPGNHNHHLLIPNLHHHHNHHSGPSAAAMPGLLPPPTTAATPGTERRSGAAVENQQALKCPRCDSSNTKFCYYNNYSLSQPRHFCKACKRYWTRGGTLRNVPVGGGCRKNKRPKKASISSSSPTMITTSTSSAGTTNGANHSQIQSSSNDMITPLLYSFPNNFSLYDLHPQMSSLQGLFLPASNGAIHGQDGQDYPSGLKSSHLPQFHPQEPPSTFDYPQLGSSSSTLSSSAAASLLTATLRQPKLQASPSAWPNYNQAAAMAIGGDFGLFKEVKPEEGNIDGANYGNRLDWLAQVPCESSTPFENVGGGGHDSSSSLFWNPNVGGWPDHAAAANCGSSITPLI